MENDSTKVNVDINTFLDDFTVAMYKNYSELPNTILFMKLYFGLS